jgi:amino acid permease
VVEGVALAASGGPSPRRLSPPCCDTLDVCVKAVLLALAACLAVSVPNFGYVVSLMGAVTCMVMSFILPAACNLTVHWRVYGRPTLALNGLVVLIGIGGMVLGVQSTLARGA